MDPVFIIIPVIWVAAVAVIILFFRGSSKLERMEARHWANQARTVQAVETERAAA